MPPNSVLIDSGPLVAILNVRDAHHDLCLAEAKRLRGTFCTSWSVVTESAHLLKHQADAVQKLLAWIRTSELVVLPLGADDITGLADILSRYADQGFDFADVSLMYLAEREAISTVFTIDRRHFPVFRSSRGMHLNLVPTMTGP